MKSRIIPLGLLLLVLLFSLACSSLTGISNRANEVKETAESVVTDAVSLATEGTPLVETAVAVITENPEIVQTIEAIATEGLDMGTAPADIPVVDKSTIQNFYGSDTIVSYTTSQDFQTVVEFYKTEMPANGWETDPSMTFEVKNTATLTWNQVGRQAIVIITVNPVDNSTVVAITIQAR